MKKIILTIGSCLILMLSFGQSKSKLSAYLEAQYNKTISDYTIGNNPWGMSLGVQVFLHNKTRFTPTMEITATAYVEDDKVLRLNPNGSTSSDEYSFNGMSNIFVGSSYSPNQNIYLSLVAGPSFISGQTYFGIKPSFGFYFSPTHKWMGKLSYINVFNRYKVTKDDFSSFSLAIGLKLF